MVTTLKADNFFNRILNEFIQYVEKGKKMDRDLKKTRGTINGNPE
jgi:hypothetical protein